MNLPPKIDDEDNKESSNSMLQLFDSDANNHKLIILSDSSDDENPRRTIRSNPASLYKRYTQDSSESVISISSSEDEQFFRIGRRSVISDDDTDEEKENKKEKEKEKDLSTSSDVYSVASASDDDVELLSEDKDFAFVLKSDDSEYDAEESHSSCNSYSSYQSSTKSSSPLKSGMAKNWKISNSQSEPAPKSVPNVPATPFTPPTQNSFKPTSVRSTFQSNENVVDEIVDDFPLPSNRTLDTATEKELQELARIKLPYFLSVQQLNARGCRISRAVELE